MALKFYNAIKPNGIVLGYTKGRPVRDANQFEQIANEADSRREHLFFPVATLKLEWSNPNTHEKGKVTTPSKDKAVNMPDGSKSHIHEHPYLGFDCDPEKYTGNDPVEAAQHYEREGDYQSDGKEMVRGADVLAYVLGVPIGHQRPGHKTRLANAMKRSCWQADRFYIAGKQCRGYWRAAPRFAHPSQSAGAGTGPVVADTFSIHRLCSEPGADHFRKLNGQVVSVKKDTSGFWYGQGPKLRLSDFSCPA